MTAVSNASGTGSALLVFLLGGSLLLTPATAAVRCFLEAGTNRKITEVTVTPLEDGVPGTPISLSGSYCTDAIPDSEIRVDAPGYRSRRTHARNGKKSKKKAALPGENGRFFQLFPLDTEITELLDAGRTTGRPKRQGYLQGLPNLKLEIVYPRSLLDRFPLAEVKSAVREELRKRFRFKNPSFREGTEVTEETQILLMDTSGTNRSPGVECTLLEDHVCWSPVVTFDASTSDRARNLQYGLRRIFYQSAREDGSLFDPEGPATPANVKEVKLFAKGYNASVVGQRLIDDEERDILPLVLDGNVIFTVSNSHTGGSASGTYTVGGGPSGSFSRGTFSLDLDPGVYEMTLKGDRFLKSEFRFEVPDGPEPSQFEWRVLDSKRSKINAFDDIARVPVLGAVVVRGTVRPTGPLTIHVPAGESALLQNARNVRDELASVCDPGIWGNARVKTYAGAPPQALDHRLVYEIDPSITVAGIVNVTSVRKTNELEGVRVVFKTSGSAANLTLVRKETLNAAGLLVDPPGGDTILTNPPAAPTFTRQDADWCKGVLYARPPGFLSKDDSRHLEPLQPR